MAYIGLGGVSPQTNSAFSGFPSGKHGRKLRPVVGVLYRISKLFAEGLHENSKSIIF